MIKSIVAAVQKSKAWASSAILITYDEGGGFFDHIAPPQLDAFGPGIRVPMTIVSPLAKPGYVDTTYSEHSSVLKLIETVFGLPTLASMNHQFDTSTPRAPTMRPTARRSRPATAIHAQRPEPSASPFRWSDPRSPEHSAARRGGTAQRGARPSAGRGLSSEGRAAPARLGVVRRPLASQAASASPIGVDGGPSTNGQISSAMARQSAVAVSSPSRANSPRLIRCRIT